MERIRADLALVGGGGAAMALLFQLCRSRHAALGGRTPGRPLRVVVLDPIDRLHETPQDRTWCFWERADPAADTATSALASAVEHDWTVLDVHAHDRRVTLDLATAGMRYAMVRSAAFYALVREAVDDPAAGVEVRWVREIADGVVDGGDGAQVRAGSTLVDAAWVFDSSPPRPTPAARTTLLQHFRGVIVRTNGSRFDPGRAVLMDLRTPQPRDGLSFGYCLPLSADRALVEYTEFSPARLDDAGYTAALDTYLDRVAGPSHERTVEHTETGAIAMSDARHRTRAGNRLFRIGTAGGATRASTGYTFAAMHRQARGVAALLRAGHVPEPPGAYPARHRRIDAVLLRGLANGRVDGTSFFPRLFERNPVGRVLDVLDGASTPAQELALMRSVPALPMLRVGASLVLPWSHG